MNSDPLAAGPADDSQSGEPDQATDIDVSGADATPLCPHCLSEFDQRASFCPQCQAPVGDFAMYDPLKQIHSTGWVYRQATHKSIPTFALVTFWCILGPVVLAGLFVLLDSGGEVRRGGLRMAMSALGLVFPLLAGVLLFRITRNYLRHRRLREGNCTRCGYDLAPSLGSSCPQCGTGFKPDATDAGSDDGESQSAQP